MFFLPFKNMLDDSTIPDQLLSRLSRVCAKQSIL